MIDVLVSVTQQSMSPKRATFTTTPAAAQDKTITNKFIFINAFPYISAVGCRLTPSYIRAEAH